MIAESALAFGSYTSATPQPAQSLPVRFLEWVGQSWRDGGPSYAVSGRAWAPCTYAEISAVNGSILLQDGIRASRQNR